MSWFKYLLILLTTFAVSHFFFSLLEKGDYLPPWLNPVRGALIFTFIVQLWIAIDLIEKSYPVLP